MGLPLGYARIRATVSFVCKFLKACSHSSVHRYWYLFVSTSGGVLQCLRSAKSIFNNIGCKAYEVPYCCISGPGPILDCLNLAVVWSHSFCRENMSQVDDLCSNLGSRGVHRLGRWLRMVAPSLHSLEENVLVVPLG